jgi:hypothetical protein
MELQRLPYRVMGDVAMSKEPNAVGLEPVGLEQAKRVDEVLENWKARTQIPEEFVMPGKSKTWGAIRIRAFGGTQGGAQHGSREPSPGSSAHSKSPTASRTYCSS